jgi:hypothetical protein
MTDFSKKQMSEETKAKISVARKKYLLNNPDKNSWQTRKYHTSIPCEKVKNLLKLKNIDFIPEFQPLLNKGRFFSIDIAFPDKKIGIEINGRQHYDSYGKLLDYYNERHNLIENNGWKLYEIPYYMAFKENIILEIINSILIADNKIEFDYATYLPIKKGYTKKSKNNSSYYTTYIAKYPNNVKHNYPKNEELAKMANEMTLKEMSGILNVNKKTLWLHLKNNGIKCKRERIKKEKIKIPYIPKRKVEWPSIEELTKLINTTSMVKIGKMFGVSDNAVRKWCKKYEII